MYLYAQIIENVWYIILRNKYCTYAPFPLPCAAYCITLSLYYLCHINYVPIKNVGSILGKKKEKDMD